MRKMYFLGVANDELISLWDDNEIGAYKFSPGIDVQVCCKILRGCKLFEPIKNIRIEKRFGVTDYEKQFEYFVIVGDFE